MSTNSLRMQADLIHRYHMHLLKLGRAISAEATFRFWAAKYSGRWHQHLTRKRRRSS